MSTTAASPRPFWKTPLLILLAGALCVLMAMGVRASFGLFLKPMSQDLGWGREVFALAMAVQNLMWGAFQPFACAIADKWGSGRVIFVGGLLYAAGLFLMSTVTEPTAFHISAGLLIGAAQAGTGLAVVLAAVSRDLPEDKRSAALGVITAAAAAGQFTVVPVGQVLLNEHAWSVVLVVLSLVSLTMAASAAPLSGKHASTGGVEQSLSAALREAARHRGYWLLTLGFFVCGFHVAFIAVHMPAYLTDLGLPTETGALSLALIGIFNVVGSYLAGVLGGRRRKKHLLSLLYLSRAAAIALFIALPVTMTTVVVFSIAIGVLWLSTVPLTSGLVAQIFGPRYMGTLFAIVFFNHQVGSFLGVWLGGYFYDATGSYDPVWYAGIALGLLAAVLHWPIDDRTIERVPATKPA
jgi:predicted MFS family arabinose efflux permease